jgi:glycosyltransferase involved in cell wall biosynthesis
MQEYVNYRFVVIDDGSTDGTGKLIQDFLKTQKKVSPDRYKVVIYE